MVILRPPGWKRPSGYANGVSAEGHLVFVSGQIGWDADERFTSDDLVEQVRRALQNTVSILAEAQAGPEHVTRMTWYILDRAEYLARRVEIGRAYRDVMGSHFPAMSMLQVSALMEEQAKVEIETTAVIPAKSAGA